MKFTSSNTSMTLSTVAVFAVWTVTSYSRHYTGKTFLNLLESSDYVWGSSLFRQFAWILLPSVTLTSFQLVLGNFLLQPDRSEMSTKEARIHDCTHVLATFGTNLSMAMMFASSTFAMKLTAPVISAPLHCLLLGTALTPWTILSLPLLVFGVMIFTYDPLDDDCVTVGLLAAFASSLISPLRAILLYRLHMPSWQRGTPNFNLDKRRILPSCCLILLSYVVIGLLEKTFGLMIEGSSDIAVYGILSSIFYVIYSYTSSAIIPDGEFTVNEEVANIFRRVLVVLLLYGFGDRYVTPEHWRGFLICILGLLIYAFDKSLTERGDNMPLNKGRSWRSLFRHGISKRVFFFVTPIVVIVYFLLKSFFVREPGVFVAAMPIQRQLRYFNDTSLEKLPLVNEISIHAGDFPPAMYGLRDTRGAIGLQRPTAEELSPNKSRLPGLSESTVQAFLSHSLIESPEEANLLTNEFTQTADVIKEAQRLHFNIVGELLKGYKYAILFDIAASENKGDPCITMGEIYLLARINLPVLFYCDPATCTTHNIEGALQIAKKYSPKDLVILLHGGGNIVLYAAHDQFRVNIMNRFKGYNFVLFPQSLSVKDFNASQVKLTKEAYCCNPNLTMIFRDRVSYDIGKKLYTGSTKLLMAPDMAFQIGHMPRFMSPVYDIMWLRREDLEKLNYRPPTSFQGYKVKVEDWVKWETPRAPNKLEQAFYCGTNGFFFLQRGRVVITDRLHGHILATLLDIPHVIIDNKAWKISRYHNTWTKSLENTVMTSDPNEALQLAVDLLKKYDKTLPPRVPYLDIKERL